MRDITHTLVRAHTHAHTHAAHTHAHTHTHTQRQYEVRSPYNTYIQVIKLENLRQTWGSW